MTSLLRQTRRAQSEIVSYVLLIVLAIGMSVAVYAFLHFYLPKNQPQCPEGTSLIIANVSCNLATNTTNISLVNKGLFNVDGVYIKAGEVGRVFRTTINCPTGSETSLETCRLYFSRPGPIFVIEPLKPGESWSGKFNYSASTTQEIEIEPLVVVENKSRVLCPSAVVTQQFTCT